MIVAPGISSRIASDTTVADVVEMMEHGWAVFERHPEGCLCKPADPLDGEDYRWCPVNDHDSWYCRWGQVDAQTPGAVPVTHLPGF